MLPQDRIRVLFNHYSEIVELETEEFGCKPTELRHLLGRLGEFYCALETQGELAHAPNQHGFDVVAANGRRISVKTTAQDSGFVSINPRTLDRVDDLMVIQFREGKLEVVYFGPAEKAIEVSRTWKGSYELDISKARRIV